MSTRDVVRGFTPPVLLQIRRRLLGHGLRFHGRPTNWAEACAMSSGYGSADILDRVVEATRAVVSGQARFERDSVVFDEPQYPFAIVAALLRAAMLNAGRLEVVDLGGSLGSTYRQCLPFLKGLASIEWSVIEQAIYVEAGRREFSSPELRFAGSIDELVAPSSNGLILASSVLQYLEAPGATLEQLGRLPSRHLVIDRTPLSEEPDDRLCIQRVPKHIYEASYPCWILSRSRLLNRLLQRWQLVCEFPCPEGSARSDDGLDFEFRGLILERRS